MNPVFKFLSPLGAVLAVSACGVIPTPPVSIPDVTLTLPASAAAMGRVVYLRQDALAGASVPRALQRLSISGEAQYAASGGTLSQVGVYVRTNLDTLPSTCTAPAPSVVVCEAAGEAGRSVGTLNLTAGGSRAFTLSGAALDEAGRAGHGYFGLRAVQGNSLAGEQLRLTGMQARAKL